MSVKYSLVSLKDISKTFKTFKASFKIAWVSLFRVVHRVLFYGVVSRVVSRFRIDIYVILDVYDAKVVLKQARLALYISIISTEI
jgi:hypothetical protein